MSELTNVIQHPQEAVDKIANLEKLVDVMRQLDGMPARLLRYNVQENEIAELRAKLERVKAENEKKTAALELIIIRCNMADFDILTVGAICKMRELAREALLPAAPEEGE